MNLKEAFQHNKGKWIPILCGFVGIMFILFGGEISHEKERVGSTEAYYEVSFYTAALEERIEALCKSIGGIDEAKALLTLDCGTEYVYAQNLNQSIAGENTNYSTDYIILKQQDEDKNALIMEIYPKIRGIAVVCTGGENPQTKQKIIELLSAALGISSNRIKVAGT